MWNRIYIVSNLAFFGGLFVFLLGEHLMPGWASVTLPAGALLAGFAGVASAVSGLILILKPSAGI